MSKFPVDKLSRWHGDLYRPLQTRVLFDLNGGDVVHRRGSVPIDWASPDFDASGWSKTPLPGERHLKPVVSVTGRETPLFLRGRMTLPGVPKRMAMHTIGAAGRWELFVNGELVMSIGNSSRAGYVPYSTIVLPASALNRLRDGDNTIALRLTADKGADAALIDFALLAVDE